MVMELDVIWRILDDINSVF